MKHRFEKNLKISDELIGFLYHKGARELSISWNFKSDVTEATVRAKLENLSQKAIDGLKEMLNTKRQPEVEECYWLVNGEDSFGDELSLVGVMIDSCEISYNGDEIEILVVRIEK